MSLGYIINRIASEEGYSNIATNVAQRERLLDLINEASRYLWEALEMPGSDLELDLNVTMGAELITPPYVGKLLAVRFHNTQDPWDITSLRPRFSNTPWTDKWNNFRQKANTTLATRIVTPTKLHFLMPIYDGTVVTVVGQTAEAHSVSEDVTLSIPIGPAPAPSTSNTWISNPTTIAKNQRSLANITIQNDDGDTVGQILNTLSNAVYLVFDVSKYPNVTWNNTEYPVEILYREPLLRLEDDSDEFPVPGWDDFIVIKVRQLVLQKNKDTLAQATQMEADLVAQIMAKLSMGRENRRARVQHLENPLLVMDKHYNIPTYDNRRGSAYPSYIYYP